MKKDLIIHLMILLFCCCLTAQPLCVSAAGEAVDGPYTYVLKEDGTAKIIQYDKSLSGELTIPGTLGGALVTEIGEFAFRGDGDVTAVLIPDGVRTIGYRAFDGNTALEQLTLPETVEQIDGGAFSGCASLTGVILPDRLARIENALFEQTGLREIVIPEGVESIGDGAFRGCAQLETVELPCSMKIIYRDAFSGCGTLQTLNYAGTDEQYSAVLIFDGNAPLTVLKGQDVSVQERTPFVPCRDNVFEVPAGATVADYYMAVTSNYLRAPGTEPYTLTRKILIQRDLRLAGIDYETYLSVQFGDLNLDGQVTAEDARNTLRISVALEQPDPVIIIAADVDHDGNVTAADARLVLRGSVDLENPDDWNA